MAYTKRDLITEAFEFIGLGSYDFDIQPDMYESALRRLDGLMASWDQKGIYLGYPLSDDPKDSDLDQDSGIPSVAVEAVTSNLALRLSVLFGRQATNEARSIARESYNALLIKAVNVPSRPMPRGVPLGAGSDRGYYQRKFTSGPCNELTVNKSDTLETGS